ncbi:MAG: group III truncated hemoglobin [Rhodobacteraceae bacterium]|nr:group III truncated hemoglobin [Paracoccaceae bacterium]
MPDVKPKLPPRFPITRDQIETVVEQFYERVRKNPVIGPVFLESLTESREIWAPHEAKIAGFWANAILHERSYDGNPMMIHAGISALKPEMFDVWLDLFADTLRQTLPEPTAAAWEALARKIGRGLRMGVESAAHDPTMPPKF